MTPLTTANFQSEFQIHRSHSPARILLADDQTANIQILGNMLDKEGYEIIPAFNGHTALKRLSMRVPDLILLDVLMPDMDGVEVCRRIRENREWKDIPIIFLSANDDKDLIVQALEAGGVDYVTKPFNHAEMLSRVRTHLMLKIARDRLKQLAEDKDELLGILAHDLKNHLGGILMSAEIMRSRMSRLEGSKEAQLCENIYHSTRQLLGFVKEFLANSAVDHGLTLQSEPIELGDIVTRTVQSHLEAARRKDLEIHILTPPDPLPLVAGDRSAVGQVIDNLLSNSIKFSSPGKQIRITIRSNEIDVECQVQDQGPGFTSEDKALMFRRYKRLSARPTGGEPSTGLGLSIVQKLIQEMKGELICESTEGKGATFSFRLPRWKSSEAP